ncbi:MAG: hypothetical protein ACI8ZM_003465 [Crocinitomix sp.]|jgi:hypothetical protein
MKIILVITLLFCTNLGFAQKNKGGPLDSTFYLNWNIGASGFSRNNAGEDLFGTSVSEETFSFGPFLEFGFEYRKKNGIGIHLDAGAHSASRSKKRFISAFDALFSDYEVLYEMTGFSKDERIKGGSYYTTEFGLSYLLRVKEVGLFPKLIVGFQSSVKTNYRYTLREIGTNNFTNYNVSNNSQWSPYFGAGFTVLFSEYDLAGISAEFAYGNSKNDYTISQSGYNQPITYQEISTVHQKFYWKISLLLRIDFASMK